MKPRIFIASSTEGLEVAYKIQEILEHNSECTVWDQDVFQPSSNTVEGLITQANRCDFGIFCFTLEDTIKIRGNEEKTVRDNVLFELGLFGGIIGFQNCFIVIPREKEVFHLPTDLAGLTPLKYEPNRRDNNLKAALGPVASQVLTKIKNFVPKVNLSEQLIMQISNVGMSAFYSTRDDYGKYRTEASSIDKYINTAKEKVILVSISLSTGIQFDDVCSVISKRIKEQPNFQITISLLNPLQEMLYKSLDGVFNVKYQELKSQTMSTLIKLQSLKKTFNEEEQKRFVIKVHNSIPFASAILLDDDLETGRIQLETKPYKVGLRKSFAMEFKNNGKEFYRNIQISYQNLIDSAIEIDKLNLNLEVK